MSRGILAAPWTLLLLPLLLSLSKAFTIDDPLFVWIAQHVLKRPLDPYGFTANWFGFPAEMWSFNVQNPPLTSYWLALAGLISFDEVILHLFMLPFPLLVVLGTMRLARQLGRAPGWAGLLCAASPVLLISSTTVMCDVMLLAIMVWAVTLWVEGLARGSLPRLFLAALLCGLAPLTKYFGLALLPLLLAYTLLRAFLPARRAPRLLIPLPLLALPLLTVFAWHLYTTARYGSSHVLGAGIYATAVRNTPGHDPTLALYAAVTFLGGCLLWPVVPLLSESRWSGRLLILVPALALGPLGYRLDIEKKSHMPFSQYAAEAQIPPENHALAALFFAAGLCALVLCARALLRRPRCPETWLLGLWFGGTVLFFAVLNWTVAARNVLPLIPPLCVLASPAARSRATDTEDDPAGEPDEVKGEPAGAAAPRAYPVAACLGLAFALWGTYAEVRWANSVRSAANTIMNKYGGQDRPIYFLGHWGFQYYMEQRGAQAVAITERLKWDPLPRAVLVIPRNNANVYWKPFRHWDALEVLQRTVHRALYLVAFEHGAGFYSHQMGAMPMLLVNGVADRYTIAQRPQGETGPIGVTEEER